MDLDLPHDLRAVPSPVLGDEVYNAIGAAIVDGRFKPGQRLRDTAIAEQLGVSRTPVREALQRLVRVGMVEVAPNRYTRVSTPGPNMYADTLEFIVYFMGDVLRIALRKCSEADLEQLLGQLDRMISASRTDDAGAQFAVNARFYELATLATGNTAIMMVMSEAELAIRRNLVGWNPPVTAAGARTGLYIALREATAARDGRRAEDIHLEINGVT